MNCCEPAVGAGSTVEPSPDSRMDAPALSDQPRRACAQCDTDGRPVTRQTVLLMLKPEFLDNAGEGDYRFCDTPECRIVYFNDTERTFTTSDVRVRVGLKEREDPIPLCYCFGFDEHHIREEIRLTDQTTISQRIADLIKQRLCSCEARNPSGACCLGEVNKAAKRLLAG